MIELMMDTIYHIAKKRVKQVVQIVEIRYIIKVLSAWSCFEASQG